MKNYIIDNGGDKWLVREAECMDAALHAIAMGKGRRSILGESSGNNLLASGSMITLTESMREYLRRPEIATAGFYDYVSGFAKEFRLTPADTANLLAQWVRESV